jgi:hypothetical protein
MRNFVVAGTIYVWNWPAIVPTARPLFLRLSSLAQIYAEKAAAAAKSTAETRPASDRVAG